MPSERRSSPYLKDSRPLLVGFVPTVDCALLVAAQELGFFSKHGVRVTLRKEVGWATVRDKLANHELHAAPAPASLAYALRCGLGMPSCACLTGFVLGLNGSAITLTRELWDRGVRDAATLRGLIEQERGRRTFRLAAVHEFSSQHDELRRWLRGGGIDPDVDVQISMLPSPVMPRGLLDGHLDGYCAEEPWNSFVCLNGAGWVAATSSQLSPGQPEKVLLVLESFAEERAEEHLGILAALLEASEFCAAPEQREELVRLLARPAYLDLPAAILTPSLRAPFPLRTAPAERHFITMGGGAANVPDRAKGRRVYDDVRQRPVAKASRSLRLDSVGRIFREDLYRAAQARAGRKSPPPGRGGCEQLTGLALPL